MRPRPNGAYKLLVMLQDMPPPAICTQAPYIHIPSIRKLSRILGTDAKAVRRWLDWLEMMGYLPTLEYENGRRAARVQLRPLRNSAHV